MNHHGMMAAVAASSHDDAPVLDRIAPMRRILRTMLVTIPILWWDVLCMALYVLCLLPAFLQMAWFYFVTAKRTSCRYSSHSCRNTLDVYHAAGTPASTTKSRPILVCAPGGAFLIGYKMWAALCAQALTKEGVVVVAMDYRNYPFGTVADMQQDVDDAMQWVFENGARYGGNVHNIVVMGQSAGAHLIMTTLLLKAIELDSIAKEKGNNGVSEVIRWRSHDIKGFVALSGPYDILQTADSFFARHGFDTEFVDSIFNHQRPNFDPTFLIDNHTDCDWNKWLPPISIWHGSADRTVDAKSAKIFASKLQQLSNGEVNFQLYPGWSHTEAILESIMDGNPLFHNDLLQVMDRWCDETILVQNQHCRTTRMCPSWMIALARKFNAF